MMPRPTDQIVVLISPMLQCITISEMIHPMIDIQDCHLPETLDHPLFPQVSPLLGDAITNPNVTVLRLYQELEEDLRSV